jgi:aspyridone synthetase trans-acting enoyl reductase
MAANSTSTTAVTFSIPRIHQALVASAPGTLRLAKDVPLPDIEVDQVLVLVRAVALNPSDWKLIDVSCTPGAVSGCDFAGTVIKIGPSVHKPLQIGDHVCGIVFGANPSWPTNGAFAEYVAATGDLCIRIPMKMSFEAASSLGAGVMSVGLALRSLGMSLESKQKKYPGLVDAKQYALVYGGSTATGTMAIQLLQLCGYHVVTTCSPNNFALVESLGVVAAFDYRSQSCKEDIREFTSGSLEHALDCITNSKSTTICYGAIGEVGGRYTAIESYPARLQHRRRCVKPDWIIGWTIFGKGVELGGEYRREPLPGDRAFAVEWVERIERLLEEGKLRPHPINVREGGLAQIILDLDILRKGKVSGMKYVYVVSHEKEMS